MPPFLPLDFKLILGSSIFTGLLLGFVIDKLKAIKTKDEELSPKKDPKNATLKRQNSSMKYYQRKNSLAPPIRILANLFKINQNFNLEYNRIRLSKKPKNTNPNNTLKRKFWKFKLKFSEDWSKN